ncbi:phosphinothricin acetyltransferase [Phycisphaerales bacterium]|nr:phosphinothricin acetyltransferase [Phycisphaerales bacterium]
MPPLAATYLRPVRPDDIPALYLHQLDPEANRMAGTKPRSLEAFQAVWDRIFKDAAVTARVIVENESIIGGVSCFDMDGLDAVGYWIAREHWGRGVATRALRLFLQEVPRRPLHATAARANLASIRVLHNCGFRLTGYRTGQETDRYVACEVAEFVLQG